MATKQDEREATLVREALVTNEKDVRLTRGHEGGGSLGLPSITPPPSLIPTNITLSHNELLLFFCLGLAPTLAWNCVFVSEAYFYNALGPAVISRLGLCQNGANLLGQGALLLGKQQVTCYRAGVSACLLYMLAMCAFLVAVPVDQLQPWHLYVLQTANGLATGVAQTLMGSLGGLYGGAGQVGGVLFAGDSMGALLPPIVQCFFLFGHGMRGTLAPSALLEQETDTARTVFTLGVLGSLAGVGAINQLAWTPNFRALTASTAALEANEDYMTVGSRPDIRRERLAKNEVRTVDALIVLCRAAWIYILAVAPYAASTVHGPTMHFWTANLATLLIVSASVGDFAGRLVANRPSWVVLSLRKLLFGTIAPMLCFVALTVTYITSGQVRDVLGAANAFAIALYFAMSMAHGYLVVCLQVAAQVTCDFYPGKDSCPLVSQLSWLSSQTGLACGIAVSFIPLGQ